jgi:hypothetical protein
VSYKNWYNRIKQQLAEKLSVPSMLIYSMDKGLMQNKNRTNGNNSNLSCNVGTTRFELATPRPPA